MIQVPDQLTLPEHVVIAEESESWPVVHEGLTYAKIVSGTIYVQEPLIDGLFSYDYQTNLLRFFSNSAATQYGGLYSEVEIQIVTSSGKEVSLI